MAAGAGSPATLRAARRAVEGLSGGAYLSRRRGPVRPARRAVSPEGIQSGNVNLPLDRVADLEVGNNGVKVNQDMLVARRGGIPTTELIKRGLGNRQAERSYTLALRGDGQSHATIIAGGLTHDCAVNLQSDIHNVMARLSEVAT
jgi:hypothetical protein